jgi:hypothetical protein
LEAAQLASALSYGFDFENLPQAPILHYSGSVLSILFYPSGTTSDFSMNFISNQRIGFTLVFLIMLFTVIPAGAQQSKSNNNHLGFGLHYAYGDVLVGNLGIQFSILYERKLSELLQIESSINFLGTNYNSDGASGSKKLAHSVTGNASAIFNLSANAPQQWRCGIGVSLRQLSSIFAIDALFPYSQDGDVIYVANYALGANALLDYKLPIDKNMDIVLRLQGQAFMQPFVNDTYGSVLFQNLPAERPFAFAVTLGAFIRIGF